MTDNDITAETALANTLLEAALDYHRREWPITLCRPNSKKPLGEGWNSSDSGKAWQRKRWTETEIKRAFREFGHLNVGVRFGAGAGIIDMEEDSPEDKKAFSELWEGCEPQVTPTFNARRGPHRLFAHHSDLEKCGKATIHFRGLEVRIGAAGKGAQSLFPPSVTNQFRRCWLVPPDECDFAALPDKVVQRLLSAAKTTNASVYTETQRHRDTETQRHRDTSNCLCLCVSV